MELMKKNFKKELVVAALFFIIVGWLIGWWTAALIAVLILLANLAFDFALGSWRARKRVNEKFLRKEAERIEAKRRQGQI